MTSVGHTRGVRSRGGSGGGTGGGTGGAARDPRPETGAPVETELRPRHPIDWRRAVLYQRRGPRDPTMHAAGAVIWRASRTPEGIATIALRQGSAGVVNVAAWGPGAYWALGQVAALCGQADDPTGFDPGHHPLVRDLHHRHPWLRIGRTDLVFDALASSIIEQKITGMQAFAAWRSLVTWFGERAPGPTARPMFAPPSIEGWRHIPSWAWHRAGLEPPQARTVVEAARRGDAIARAAASATATAPVTVTAVDGTAPADTATDSENPAPATLGGARDRVLMSLRGVGAWTAAETRIRAFGDPDAVSVGDFHLAHEVGYVLTGRRVDDDGMLHLLAPWAGQRQRVIRLIELSGIGEPRRGPRLSPEDHRER